MFVCENVILVFEFHNSLPNKNNNFQNMKNKSNVMGVLHTVSQQKNYGTNSKIYMKEMLR